MSDTPMDLYVKEYLVRHILTSSKYNPEDPALEEQFSRDMWEQSLGSMRWQMVGSLDSIVLTKEEVSYTIKWYLGKAYVQPTDKDAKGIRYAVGGEFAMTVYRYMLSCPIPVETPPSRIGTLTKHFFAGKFDIVDDVELRRFKAELVQMVTKHTSMVDQEPSHYKGVATTDRVVLNHNSGKTFIYETRRPISGWDLTWMLEERHHRKTLSGEETMVLSQLCKQIETDYTIYI